LLGRARRCGVKQVGTRLRLGCGFVWNWWLAFFVFGGMRDLRSKGMLSVAAMLVAVVQEELGLRLEAAKAPVETLVIDRVERPAEN
jgi:hypothetical protein